MALGDYVTEFPERRKRDDQTLEIGEVSWHTRMVTMPEGKIETEMADALALGAVIPARWWLDGTADPGSSPGAALLAGRRRVTDEAKPTCVLRYLEIKGGTVTNGYMETARHPVSKSFRTFYTIWGAAAAVGSTGIPALDDLLDGGTGVTVARCIDVTKDTERYPGRILVRSTWVAVRAYA